MGTWTHVATAFTIRSNRFVAVLTTPSRRNVPAAGRRRRRVNRENRSQLCKKLADADAERFRNPQERGHGNILLAAFNPPEIVRVKLRLFRQNFQAPTFPKIMLGGLRGFMHNGKSRNYVIYVNNKINTFAWLRLRSPRKPRIFFQKPFQVRARSGAAWRTFWKGASRCLERGCVRSAPLHFGGSGPAGRKANEITSIGLLGLGELPTRRVCGFGRHEYSSVFPST